jgi:hypothetical protein
MAVWYRMIDHHMACPCRRLVAQTFNTNTRFYIQCPCDISLCPLGIPAAPVYTHGTRWRLLPIQDTQSTRSRSTIELEALQPSSLSIITRVIKNALKVRHGLHQLISLCRQNPSRTSQLYNLSPEVTEAKLSLLTGREPSPPRLGPVSDAPRMVASLTLREDRRILSSPALLFCSYSKPLLLLSSRLVAKTAGIPKNVYLDPSPTTALASPPGSSCQSIYLNPKEPRSLPISQTVDPQMDVNSSV